LFILTTVDAGTRVGRFLIQAFLGQFFRPLADTRSYLANVFASLLLVSAWGYFLYQGVIDPQGGINSLWPLFGIANQLLAVVALCLATTIIIKMGKGRHAWVTLLPLAWLATVTFTAGWQKLFHASPRIGFLSGARKLAADIASGAIPEAKAEATRRMIFNLHLDAVVAGAFLIMVGSVLIFSGWRWVRLSLGLDGRELREHPPVWLTEEIVALEKASGFFRWMWALSLLLVAVLRHLAGEGPLAPAAPCAAEIRNAPHAACVHESGMGSAASADASAGLAAISPQGRAELGRAWAEKEEQRFRRPRCC
jgi:hypothetical protein